MMKVLSTTPSVVKISNCTKNNSSCGLISVLKKVCNSVAQYFSPTTSPTTKINLHPKNASQVQFYRATEIDVALTNGNKVTDMLPGSGFISDFAGTGEPALVVHGAAKVGLFAITPPIFDVNGIRQQSKLVGVTPKEYVVYLNERFSIDLKKEVEGKGRLHLLSCYSGGKDGNAQHLANALGTVVAAYVDENTQCMVDPLSTLLGNPEAFVGKTVDSVDVPTKPIDYKART